MPLCVLQGGLLIIAQNTPLRVKDS